MKPIIFALCLLSLSSISVLFAGDWGPWTAEDQKYYDNLMERRKQEQEKSQQQSAKENAIILKAVGGFTGIGLGAWVAYEGFRQRRAARDLENFQWPAKGTVADKNLIAWIRTGNRGILAAGFMGMGAGMKLLSDAIEKSRE